MTTGFTCGIAITIMMTQVKDFLGLQLATVPAEFFSKLEALGRALPTLSGPTLAVGLASVVIIVFWPKPWGRFVPGSIVAVILGTFAVNFFHLPVATITSHFGAGAFPDGLPVPRALVFDWQHLGSLLAPAVAITMMGAIESLLSAVVADGMIDDRHDSNQELMAQGIANFTVPFFGGIPVTGVLARTATNVRNGANSPVAGMVHALTLLLVVLLAAPLAKLIPLTVLGAVLLVVAVRMGEWDEFLLLGRQTKSDAAVFVVTFTLTTCFDLTVAVKWGLILAGALFIKRITDTTHVLEHDDDASLTQGHEPVADLPKGVLVFRVFGALMFGAADKLESVMRRAGADTKVVILHMAAVTALDATALNALETLYEKLQRHGKRLVLSGPHTQPYFLMDKAGFLDRVGPENITGDLAGAVVRARELVAEIKTKRASRAPF